MNILLYPELWILLAILSILASNIRKTHDNNRWKYSYLPKFSTIEYLDHKELERNVSDDRERSVKYPSTGSWIHST